MVIDELLLFLTPATISAQHWYHSWNLVRINFEQCQAYHDQYQILQAAEPFLVGSISFIWNFIVKSWKKPATLQIICHVLENSFSNIYQKHYHQAHFYH